MYESNKLHAGLNVLKYTVSRRIASKGASHKDASIETDRVEERWSRFFFSQQNANAFRPSITVSRYQPLHRDVSITDVNIQLKPGFHYPSWRPELTARVDAWPVSITRQHGSCWRPINSASGNARPSTRPVLTGNGNRWPVNSGRQLG